MSRRSVYAAEAAYVIERYDAEVRAVGLADVWDRLLSEPETPTKHLLLGCVGAVASFMHETGTARAASP